MTRRPETCSIVGTVALTDGVVRLRPFAPSDVPALLDIWRDPEIRSRNTVPEPTQDAALAWISARDCSGSSAWEWAVEIEATGELAGRRALKHLDWEQGRAEAACWVGSGHRGQRIAPRSLRLAAAHAFSLGIVRVEAHCESDNAPSIRSVVAAGMRHEGTLRSYFVTNSGTRADAEVFGLLPGDLGTAPEL